ncbi:hypothetical protein [Bacillus glycinifermentans]|uniref:hypothetical protein n=1 Tax=Bacillus glycinifermentans TaxID=1664069 RepID=UPI0022E905F8|nr:hypothetical protein [Bacillus glycinifermentans]MEC3609205.1 hypothetical protein [Bacillus glycinifermentans]
MDWLEFVSSMVQSLAWPVTLAMIVWLLKEPVSERLKELIKLKYKDFELEFGMRVQALASARGKRNRALASIKAENPPQAVVESAWAEVEEALREAAKRLESDSGSQGVLHVIDTLYEQGEVTKEAVSELRELWNLRFMATGDISSDSALEYRSLCSEAAETLRSASKMPSTY